MVNTQVPIPNLGPHGSTTVTTPIASRSEDRLENQNRTPTEVAPTDADYLHHACSRNLPPLAS